MHAICDTNGIKGNGQGERKLPESEFWTFHRKTQAKNWVQLEVGLKIPALDGM
jgi:hypothetical protein